MTRRLTEDGLCSGASATIEWLDNGQSYQVRVTAVGDAGQDEDRPPWARAI